MSIECIGKFLMSFAIVAGLAIVHPAASQAQINDSISRHNGASFWANQRTSRNIQHSRDYSRGIQRYTRQAQVIQPTVTQAESQMLGQQLQAIQRDMVIVRKENASNPKVVEQVKKIETQLGQATTLQKSLHEECCKIHASLDEMKKEHDKLLKELGHEEAAHDHHENHDHHDHEATGKTVK